MSNSTHSKTAHTGQIDLFLKYVYKYLVISIIFIINIIQITILNHNIYIVSQRDILNLVKITNRPIDAKRSGVSKISHISLLFGVESKNKWPVHIFVTFCTQEDKSNHPSSKYWSNDWSKVIKQKLFPAKTHLDNLLKIFYENLCTEFSH